MTTDMFTKATDNDTASEVDKERTNQYALFEEFIAFLKIEESAESKLLNPVLLGYWCNLFRSFVITHPNHVFRYVYTNSSLIESMIEHLYSPLMSDLVVRLLNFSKSVLRKQSNEF